MSFILKKIFNMRDKASEKRGQSDTEKPFLEHLEDLRVTLMKIVGTLLVTSILCFVFKSELMDFITHPVKLAQLDKVGIQDLPEDMEATEWQKSYNIATSASSLPPEKRQIYIDAACGDNKTLRTDVKAVTIFRAALTIPEDEREAFLKKMAADDEALLKRVLSFLKANPDATLSDLDRKSNLVDMSALQPAEGFTLSIKLAFFGGIILAFPFLVFYILEFVLPGLTPKEKKMLVPSGIVGFALFLGGVAFAYWVVTPKALEFFTEYDAEMGIRTDWRIGYYVSFVLRVTLIFGLCFELPVVVMALVKLGIISFSGMIKTRSYAVLIIVILSAVVTPPDAITLTFLALPMIVLYEICIWVAWFMERKEKKLEEKEREEYRKRMEAKRKRQQALGDTSTASSVAGASDDGGHDPHHGPDYNYTHDHEHDHDDHDPYDHYHDEHDPYHDDHADHADHDPYGHEHDPHHDQNQDGEKNQDGENGDHDDDQDQTDSDHLEQDEAWQLDQEDPSPSEDDIYEPFDDEPLPKAESAGDEVETSDGDGDGDVTETDSPDVESEHSGEVTKDEDEVENEKGEEASAEENENPDRESEDDPKKTDDENKV